MLLLLFASLQVSFLGLLRVQPTAYAMRYSVGLMPTCRLKKRVKCCGY